MDNNEFDFEENISDEIDDLYDNNVEDNTDYSDDAVGFSLDDDFGDDFGNNSQPESPKGESPVIAIVAISVAIVVAVVTFCIIKFSAKKGPQTVDVPVEGTTASGEIVATVDENGDLLINGVQVDPDEVGIDEDEVSEYANNVNNGTVTVPNRVVVNHNITTKSTTKKSTTAKAPSTAAPTNEVIKIQKVKFIAGKNNKVYLGTKPRFLLAFTPYDTTQTGVEFKSSDPSIASVDHLGYVTPHKEGKITLTVTSKVNKSLKDTINITVEERTTAEDKSSTIHLTTRPRTTTTTTMPTVPSSATTAPSIEEINSLTIDSLYANREVGVGMSTLATSGLKGDGSTVKANSLNFSSSDSSVCTVDANGRIFGVQPGTATITISPKKGTAASVSITVTVR